MNELHALFQRLLAHVCSSGGIILLLVLAVVGLLVFCRRIFGRGFLAALLLLPVTFIAIRTGALKAPQSESDWLMRLDPVADLQAFSDGAPASAEVSSEVLATDLLPGGSVGPLAYPEDLGPVTTLRLFGVALTEDDVLLGVAWPHGFRSAGDVIDIYGGPECDPPSFDLLRSFDVSGASSNVAVALPRIFTNGFYRAVARPVPSGTFLSSFSPVATVSTPPGFGLSAATPAVARSLPRAAQPADANGPSHVVFHADAVTGDDHPAFTSNYTATVRSIVDATVPFTLSADDDADLTVGGRTLSVRWHPDRGAPRTEAFTFAAGGTTPLFLRHYNDGGASFLDCTALSGPSYPSLEVEPQVRLFYPDASVDFRSLAPAVRVTGTLDPLCDYTVRALVEPGLDFVPDGRIVPAHRTPLDVELPVWPRASDPVWTAEDAPHATVAYVLCENGIPRATNTCTFVCLAPKLPDDECACNEGLSTRDGCVDVSQRFGSSPRFPGIPDGRVVVRADRPNAALRTPRAFRYDHPMMRCVLMCRNLDAVILDGLGRASEYREGLPSGASLGAEGQIFRDADGTLVEELPGRLRVRYADDGSVASLQPEFGSPVTVSALGIRPLRAADGSLAAVESDTDGCFSASATGDGTWRLTWTSPVGATVKTFDFGGAAPDEFTLVETRNAAFTFRYRWTFVPAQNDWTFEKFAVTEEGDAVLRRETKTLAYDAGSSAWTSCLSALGPDGTAAVAEASVLDRNGHAPCETARIDATTGRVLASSVLDGSGRVAAATDSLGCTTEYVRDALGRVVRETVAVPGLPVRVTETAYADGPGVPDFRPVRRRTLAGGIVLLEETFAYGPHARSVTRTAGGVSRTSRTACDAYARPVLSVGEDGRATQTSRTEPAADGSWTETPDEGVWTDAGFALVDGKSTRTATTYSLQGDAVRQESLALVGGAWRSLSWVTNRFNAAHKAVFTAHSDGTSESADWICPGPVFRTGRDGVTVTNVYDAAKRLAASVRKGPFGDVTTAFVRDPADRVVREAVSAPGCETQIVSRAYDSRGRIVSETDAQGRVTAYAYSADDRTETVTYADGGTRTTVRNADGSLALVSGTAVTPEYHTYGVTEDGLEWTCVRYGRPDSPRYEKTYRNGFGETVRTERPGFGGTTIVTENAYDAKGRLVSTSETGSPTVTYAYDDWGDLVETTQSAGGVTRTVEESQGYALLDGEVWRGGTRTVRTSDATIAPLVTASWSKASGLSLGCIDESFTVDVRGNTNRTWSALDPSAAKRTTRSQQAGVGNVAFTESTDGVTVRMVDAGCVTNTAAYDAYRRTVATADGRGNVTATAYDPFGRVSSVTDATNAVTRYVYDTMGRVAEVTNALGGVTFTRYDLRGNKTYEGGATYPVSYAYDVYGNRTSMTTYRDESETAGDTTTWVFDEATGLVTQKLYADGQGPCYTYTDDGNLATRTWARGVTTSYTYDDWGSLTSTTYSDGTPSVTFAYDVLGRRTSVTDAKGTTVFTYDAFGDESQEAVTGLYAKTLVRHRDAYGRDLGHTMDGTRKNVIKYDAATGRISREQLGGAWYVWGYLPGTSLKSSLSVGTAATTTWSYEPHRDLLTQVRNTVYGSVASQYDYANDALGRRTAIGRSGTMMSETRSDAYGYNDRSELVSAAKNGVTEYAYEYDDIGNRESSVEPDNSFSYSANELNQYTSILQLQLPTPTDFTPQYDADGNQTLVKTKTGIWSVTYNGENRPVSWTCGATNLMMSYDHMSRRVEYIETAVDPVESTTVTNRHQKFVYDGYLCIQRLNGADNAVTDLFEWDPTEPVATRPLYWQPRTSQGNFSLFYTHDGNKNVSEAVHYQRARGVAAHYEYAPFGEVTAQTRGNAWGSLDLATDNPWRFSSEYADDASATVYYNYRHYEPMSGRWTGRDLKERSNEGGLYVFVGNMSSSKRDYLGLKWVISRQGDVFAKACADSSSDTFQTLARLVGLDASDVSKWAHTDDVKPALFKSYDIPNHVVFHFGKKMPIDSWPTSMFAFKRRACQNDMDNAKLVGFKVSVANDVNASQIKTSLSSDGLYKYTYLGHGSDSYINTYPDEMANILGPGRYTKYGISRLQLFSCMSAHDDIRRRNTVSENVAKRIKVWSSNVARAGWFIGYSGSPNIFTEMYSWTPIRGINSD